MKTKRSRLALTLSLAAVGTIALGATTARADWFSDAVQTLGLTGGGNSAKLYTVHTGKRPARIFFHSGLMKNLKAGVTKFDGPLVDAEIFCNRSGYRPLSFGDKVFPVKKSSPASPRVTVEASLAEKPGSHVPWQIHEACLAGRKSITLPVAVEGICKKSTDIFPTPVGKTSYEVSTPAKNATFKLSCIGYDVDTLAKCANGGCG
jgi:hypothetical protein